MDSETGCARTSPKVGTCIQALAAGWINANDLCPRCTTAFMMAVGQIGDPLEWHPNYLLRSAGVSE